MFFERHFLRLSISITKLLIWFESKKRKFSEQLGIRSEMVYYKELECNYNQMRHLTIEYLVRRFSLNCLTSVKMISILITLTCSLKNCKTRHYAILIAYKTLKGSEKKCRHTNLHQKNLEYFCANLKTNF